MRSNTHKIYNLDSFVTSAALIQTNFNFYNKNSIKLDSLIETKHRIGGIVTSIKFHIKNKISLEVITPSEQALCVCKSNVNEYCHDITIKLF